MPDRWTRAKLLAGARKARQEAASLRKAAALANTNSPGLRRRARQLKELAEMLETQAVTLTPTRQAKEVPRSRDAAEKLDAARSIRVDAERLRELAAKEADSDVAREVRRIAAEMAENAANLERLFAGKPPKPRGD